MENNFTCPICGAKYDTLTALKDCVCNHEKADKENRARETERKIEALKTKNNELLKAIRKNCEELRKLGYNATVTYTTLGSTRQETSQNGNKKSFTIENDLETFLKTMFGGY